jgi:two-component system sensor kinase FixL
MSEATHFPQDSATLAAIVQSAVDGIVLIDARGRIEAFNLGAERLFGYSASEVIGRNVSMLMPQPYRQEHDAYLERYLTSGVKKIIGIGREVRARRKDGSTFPVHLSVGEMLVGGERKFTGIVHDLTSRVQMEEQLRDSEARWRAIVETAVDGIVVIDERGRIEAFNQAAERLFGYGADEVLGRNVNMLMPSPYHEEHDAYLDRYLTSGVKKIIGIGRAVLGRRKDGTTFPIHLSVGEMTVGGERKFSGIIHDLTSRVQLEEQLREQSALATLGEMAAVLAHEVKNPLAAVRGAIQVIGGRLPPESKEAAVMTEVIRRVDGLNDLMKDLLLFARPPQPKPAPVDVVSLLEMTAGLLNEDAAFKDLRVDISGSVPPVMADASLLGVVFENLLLNSAQAMKGKGIIGASVTSIEGRCEIVIIDSGPGISPEVREKMFTPFFTTKSKGTGLGLPTTKRFVEAHGGTITVECPAGGGTTITVRLPLS